MTLSLLTACLAAATALGAWSRPLGPTGDSAGPGGKNVRPVAELEGVGIEEHLGGRPNLSATMTDSQGQPRRLTDIVDGRRPTILTFNYSSCPMLCSLQLDGLVDALKQVTQWLPGRDFNLMTVSIDPGESQQRAAQFKQKYLDQYQRPEAAAGWTFLRGQQADVQRLADEVGFKYKYVPEQKEYAHTAALVLLSGDGVISRYLYGVMFEPRDLRLGLAEASQGKVGSTLEQILLFCFHYDASRGRYAPLASNIMRLAGALTTAVLAGTLVALWRRERRRQPVGQV